MYVSHARARTHTRTQGILHDKRPAAGNVTLSITLQKREKGRDRDMPVANAEAGAEAGAKAEAEAEAEAEGSEEMNACSPGQQSIISSLAATISLNKLSAVQVYVYTQTD